MKKFRHTSTNSNKCSRKIIKLKLWSLDVFLRMFTLLLFLLERWKWKTNTSLWDYRAVGPAGCRTNGLSDYSYAPVFSRMKIYMLLDQLFSVKCVVDHCLSFCPFSLVIDYHQREEHLPAPSDVRQFNYNFPFGITATTDLSCETTSLELQPVVVSEIPDWPVWVSFCFCFVFCFSLVNFESLPFSCPLPQIDPQFPVPF